MRSWEWSIFVVALLLTPASFYIALVDWPKWLHFYKWFDETFGIPSPTSGTTRAFVSLAAGQVQDALLYNAVASLAAAYLAIYLLYFPLSAWRRRELVLSDGLRKWGFWTLFALVFVNWGIKIALIPELYW